jgi:hypothetical protein
MAFKQEKLQRDLIKEFFWSYNFWAPYAID